MKPILTYKNVAIAGALCLLIALSLKLQTSSRNTRTIQCQSRQILIHDDFKADANYGFTFSENKGEVTIHGLAMEKNEQITISRAIKFTFINNDDVYILKNTNIEYLSSADSQKSSQTNVHYPAFYYESGKELILKIVPDKYDNSVIYLHNMPLFYCKKM
ncbi:hypothetical protein EDF82_3293 [Raoultella sp. BIGb0399]|uniref:FidL-like membrane protein n=1 Tax=Raoultella lignicola TaxID=3040939 RepID=A0ABU9F883_9ENTR|nr:MULTISPECIES: hypothetical protein [Enterobacteriaceae]QNK07566.1 hypothetical protein HF679_22870 [Enterobacter sp. JUb54]ROS10815.1 hypothetical protein EDF82_3293 [Raoultella sp. BIGb0399]